jgi:hypothetical protein
LWKRIKGFTRSTCPISIFEDWQKIAKSILMERLARFDLNGTPDASVTTQKNDACGKWCPALNASPRFETSPIHETIVLNDPPPAWETSGGNCRVAVPFRPER